MIESVKDKLWDILKQKEVSLAMLFSRDGRILWHKGREVIGKTIEDGEGFSKSSIGATIEKGGHFEKEGAFATLSGSNLPLSAMTLQVKSLIIQQVDPDLFLYIDSGVKESFTTSDRDMFRIIGELLGKTIETIKDRHVGIAGSSQAAGRLRELVLRYSLEEEPVLLIGETGVGKSYVAELIHQFSGRKGRFVIVNCPTIPENLLESEIFGHRKGAFTGADANKKGLLEEADGGTFLLDEIGEVPVTVQAKLLQLLDTRKYRVLGDTKERTADVRIIAATNRDLQEDIETKRFRQDLYYRLNVLPIKIPPLRERKEDIRSIVQENMMLLRGKSIVSGFWEAIMDHAWPGNARELIHVLKRAGIAIEEPAIGENIRDIIQGTSKSKTQGAGDMAVNIRDDIKAGKTFWETAWRSFMDRDLSRADLKTFLDRCFEENDRNIKRMCRSLNIPDKDYPRFVSALHKYDIHPKKKL